ncbi:hypothetical protein TNCV_631781 [Trichonephila clavipes]|nr:hypothetical protein TNCV_631781 [Trichonephila clavipes]
MGICRDKLGYVKRCFFGRLDCEAVLNPISGHVFDEGHGESGVVRSAEWHDDSGFIQDLLCRRVEHVKSVVAESPYVSLVWKSDRYGDCGANSTEKEASVMFLKPILYNTSSRAGQIMPFKVPIAIVIYHYRCRMYYVSSDVYKFDVLSVYTK